MPCIFTAGKKGWWWNLASWNICLQLPESASEMEWEYVVVELKLIEESGLATCFGLSEVLIKWAKFGVKPQFGSVGVVGSFLVAERRK